MTLKPVNIQGASQIMKEWPDMDIKGAGVNEVFNHET